MEPEVGYVQGMSFVAGGLLYHAGEVPTFFLLKELMDKYGLKDVFVAELPGLAKHEREIEALGRKKLPELFEKFDEFEIKLSFFSTDWIMSIFLNAIPLDINHLFLTHFFDSKWEIFYRTAVSLLSYYEPKLMKLNDFPSLIGVIKQAKEGCEHLLPSDVSASIGSITQSDSTPVHEGLVFR